MASLRPAVRAVVRARQSLAFALRVTPKRFESSSAQSQPPADLQVGELQGASFKIEPLRRTGESPDTMRARMLCTPAPFPLPFLLCPTAVHPSLHQD